MALYQALEDPYGETSTAFLMGTVARRTGDLETARRLFAQAVRGTEMTDIEDRRGLSYLLSQMMLAEHAVGNPEQAARLAGATASQWEYSGVPVPPSWVPEYTPLVEALQAELGAAAYAALWSEGHGLSQRGVLALASGRHQGKR